MLMSLGPWSWLIVGVVLMLMEVVAPGVFLLWPGLAAFLTGLIAFAITMTWQIQVLLFAVFAIAAIPLWRRFSFGKGSTSESPFLNRRTEALVGRVFTLERPIVDGSGTVRIDDTVWRVAGPDAPAGSRVRVTHVDGASLTVAIE